MAERFKGRAAIVTGGASGIGAGIVQRLRAEGVSVSLWDLQPGELVQSGSVHGVALDVTDADAVQRAAEATVAALGKIDILIASAGITGPNHTVWEYPVAAWDRVIDVNLKGVFYCNRAVVPFMQRNGYGRIVNIASIAGQEGNPNASAYSASKAGVIGLTKSFVGQGTRRHRNPRQLRDPRRGQDANLRSDDAAADRLDAVEDSNRPVRRNR
jgi:3-oxoacyl-[acyl-carrier protein] reductase